MKQLWGGAIVVSLLATNLTAHPPRWHWQVTADVRPTDRGGMLELYVATNNDAVIVSVVVVDPEGGLFDGEVRMS